MTTDAPVRLTNKQVALSTIEARMDAVDAALEEVKLRCCLIMRHGKPFKVIFDVEDAVII